MKILIIEDEAAAFNNIKHLLSEIEPEIEIIAHFDTVVESVNYLRTEPQPDLIFMDIELADGSAFNIFECINIDTPIIFTTAYDHYAIKAFEVNSVDYLLKPITSHALSRALDKYKHLHIKLTTDPFSWDNAPIRRILVPYRDRIIPIKTEQIAIIYATNGKTTITTTQNQTYGISKTLDTLYQRLDHQYFYRANRQYIIARDAIESFTIWGDSRLYIHTSYTIEEPILIAKNRAAEFKEWLSIL